MSITSMGDPEDWPDPAVRHSTAGPQPVAEADCYLPRPELGPDVATFVAAGTEIPKGLEGRDRLAAWPSKPARRAKPPTGFKGSAP
jgi:hypothetical protein